MDIHANRRIESIRPAGQGGRSNPLRVRFQTIALSGLCVFLLFAGSRPAYSDNSTEKKRALMATVKRLIVVPPYFATDTLAKADSAHRPDRADGEQATPAASAAASRLTEYADQLRKLTEHAASVLPTRAAARTPFTVVPIEEVAAALKALELTPEKLFQNGGRMRGTRFPTPDPETVKKLAARLHGDALLLTALDEPRRKNGRYVFNLLAGIDYRNAQVEARGEFFVLMADGATALTDDVDVAHPLTHIGTREYLFIDWLEAQDVMIEDLFDEWARYLPAK